MAKSAPGVLFTKQSGRSTIVFGKKLPDFGIFYQKNNLFAVKILTIKELKKDTDTQESIIAVSREKVACISSSKDEHLAKSIESNLDSLKNPDAFTTRVIDSYMDFILEYESSIEKEINTIEDYILQSKTRHTMKRIFRLKSTLIKIRQVNKNFLRIVSIISRRKKGNFSEATTLYEQVLHFDEITENYKEILSNMIDAHLNVISNRLNQVMKVLAIIATVTMPFTIISSLFGMNVELPLQNSPYSFPILMGIIFAIVLAMIGIFARLGWFREKY